MSLMRLKAVTKRFERNLVLRDINLRVDAGERIGLVGSNGSGKTTLLQLVLGRIEPDDGTVAVDRGVRTGYFSQTSELAGHSSTDEVLLEVVQPLREIEDELSSVADALAAASGDALGSLIDRQSHLMDQMARLDGWSYQQRIDTVLSKLGFDDELRARPIENLSSGWRHRAALARVLLEAPDVLLLDEPTNYLDVEGLAWLEDWVGKFPGAVVIVSHDRHFLEEITTRIIELENHRLHEYPGTFDDYVRGKQTHQEQGQREFKHEQELLLYESEAIAERRRDRSDPSSSVRRRLANIKKMARQPKPVEAIITDLYAPGTARRSGATVETGLHLPTKILRAETISKAYAQDKLFSNLSFELEKGERLAIVGRNGAGKSTLIRLLTSQEDPDSGRVVWGVRCEPTSFEEQLGRLDPGESVIKAIKKMPMVHYEPYRKVRQFLELLRFSEHAVDQRCGELSHGQRARVALAQCLLSGASCLVLDEPTNHLDLLSIQVMERALVHFPGAVIVVSHDRFFIDKVATRLLVFHSGTVESFAGTWSAWRASSTQ
jgi:ATP-binding cassette subfamily F protein 3